jgi:hypothetical protein
MSYYQSIHSKAVTRSRNTNFHLESMIYAPPLGQSIDSKLLNEIVPYIIEIKGRFKLGDGAGLENHQCPYTILHDHLTLL